MVKDPYRETSRANRNIAERGVIAETIVGQYIVIPWTDYTEHISGEGSRFRLRHPAIPEHHDRHGNQTQT